DPTDANVVYVGGSDRWGTGGDLAHSIIRVDTGNMREATGSTLYDGDDLDKAAQAQSQGGFYDPAPINPANIDPYKGEGVYWYDMEQMSSDRVGFATSLPAVIHALTFDAQGRLLLGT